MQFELMGVAQHVCLISLNNLVIENKVTNLANLILLNHV